MKYAIPTDDLELIYKCSDKIIIDIMMQDGKMMNQHRKPIFCFEIPQYTEKYIQPPVVKKDLGGHIV